MKNQHKKRLQKHLAEIQKALPADATPQHEQLENKKPGELT